MRYNKFNRFSGGRIWKLKKRRSSNGYNRIRLCKSSLGCCFFYEYNVIREVDDEIGDEILKYTHINLTADENELNQANTVIITVPTTIYEDLAPDISYVVEASKIVGHHISLGSVVIYESTVVPGFMRENTKKY